jgi:hypothetical protein
MAACAVLILSGSGGSAMITAADFLVDAAASPLLHLKVRSRLPGYAAIVISRAPKLAGKRVVVLCMAIHKRLHIADPEVGELAERLSHLLGKNKTESLRQVLREKIENLARAHTAQQRNRAILALVDQKLATSPTPLSKQEIEEMIGL